MLISFPPLPFPFLSTVLFYIYAVLGTVFLFVYLLWNTLSLSKATSVATAWEGPTGT